jgi:hypothetical protein
MKLILTIMGVIVISLVVFIGVVLVQHPLRTTTSVLLDEVIEHIRHKDRERGYDPDRRTAVETLRRLREHIKKEDR